MVIVVLKTGTAVQARNWIASAAVFFDFWGGILKNNLEEMYKNQYTDFVAKDGIVYLRTDALGQI